MSRRKAIVIGAGIGGISCAMRLQSLGFDTEIVEALEITAKLMELHNENPFKVKAIVSAAFKLSKLSEN
jgi:heterodisulfide reductase subunit A-like polyferredoxin